jgi:hypothetical protein
VAGLIAMGLFGTEQRHDLIGAHASHLAAAGRVPQPPNQSLSPALRSLGPHNLQHTTDLDYLNLISAVQSMLGPQVRGDGDLALAVQYHDLPPTSNWSY